MAKKKLIWGLPRTGLILLEIGVGLAVVVAGIAGAGLYRLSQGPVDLSFALSTIQNSLSDKEKGITASIQDAVASWDGAGSPITLTFKRIDIWQQGRPIIETQDVSIGLSALPLLIGKIRPQTLSVRSPLLTFERLSDRSIHFVTQSFDRNNTTSSSPPSFESEQFLSDMIKTGGFGSSVLSNLEQVDMRGARIRVVDHILGTTWQLDNVGLNFQAVDEGSIGNIVLQLSEKRSLAFRLIYNRALHQVDITSTMDDISLPALMGRIMGMGWLKRQQLPLSGTLQIKATLDPLDIDTFEVRAKGHRGFLIAKNGLSIPVENADIDISYDKDNRHWNLKNLNLFVRGMNLSASADLRTDKSGTRTGSLSIKAPELKIETVRSFWPQEQAETGFGKWITKRLEKGTLRDIRVDVPLAATGNRFDLISDETMPTATFSFSDLTADYHAPLYPVQNGKGTGIYKDDALKLSVTGGSIDSLQIKEGEISITDLQKDGGGIASIHTVLNGPLSSILRYIARDPISMGDKLKAKPEDVKGSGTYDINVSFPTIHDVPKEAFDVDVTAQLQDISIPKVTKDQTLSGGPFTLSVSDGKIGMKGQGKISDSPITLDWSQPLTPKKGEPHMTLQAQIASTPNTRKAFGADLPYLSGTVPLDLTYTETSTGSERIDIKADLTPSPFKIDDFSYLKPAGTKGNASASLIVQKGTLVKAENVAITAPDLLLKNGTVTFGEINKEVDVTGASFKTFNLVRGIASLDYKRTAQTKKITIRGRKFDVAPILDSDAPPAKNPSANDVDIQVSELYMAKGAPPLLNAMLKVKTNKSQELVYLDLLAKAGTAPATFQYIPNDKGQMTLKVNSGDAGAFLKAVGIYDNIVRGTLSLNGAPIGNSSRDVKGNLVIRDFSVVKAPILAQLLGALSLEGIGEQLGNKGIVFSRLQSGFAWVNRPGKDIMSFKDGRTSGSALGLTFNGLYNRKAKQIDITGTIIPAAGINTFASKIPLIGRLITGGRNKALFAATYSIKGPSNNPRTLVNPLSVLTPGILRDIFFEDEPDDITAPARPAKEKKLFND